MVCTTLLQTVALLSSERRERLPAFAADGVAAWWQHEGQKRYQQSKRLLILADGGGGNRSSSRVWRSHLQEKLCDRYGLSVTVCHYPPGASKWNPVEHSLFNHISRNWEGEPLESFEKILKFIRTTTTDVGLQVRALLNTQTYPNGVKISDEKMMSLSIRKGRALPKWNYTIRPRRMSK